MIPRNNETTDQLYSSTTSEDHFPVESIQLSYHNPPPTPSTASSYSASLHGLSVMPAISEGSPFPKDIWSVAGSSQERENHLDAMASYDQNPSVLISTSIGGAFVNITNVSTPMHNGEITIVTTSDTATPIVCDNVSSTNQSTSTVPKHGRPKAENKLNLASLRSRLEKTKEQQKKAVVTHGTNKPVDYHNIGDFTPYIQENPVTVKNPADKKPITVPRKSIPGSTNAHSESTSSSRTYTLWQCAGCQVVNETHHGVCQQCKLARGNMANRDIFCHHCQLLMFIPLKKIFEDTCCPRCKHVYESAL